MVYIFYFTINRESIADNGNSAALIHDK